MAWNIALRHHAPVQPPVARSLDSRVTMTVWHAIEQRALRESLADSLVTALVGMVVERQPEVCLPQVQLLHLRRYTCETETARAFSVTLCRDNLRRAIAAEA
jgi:hypothetical protein